MKKLLLILLCLTMLFVFAGCNNNETPVGSPPEAENTNTPTEEESGVSPTVEQLYAAFDQAMTGQIGTMPESFGDIKVGAVIISLSNPFWVNMSECYAAAGTALGVPIDVQTGTTEGDTASQLDVLMTMADMDYDVSIVSPSYGTHLIPCIAKCNENRS